VGWVTPLGSDLRDVWQRLLKGQSGIRPISLFDASQFSVRIAAEVPNWSIREACEDPVVWNSHPRQTQFAIASAKNAVRQAGLDLDSSDPTRRGVYLGCGETYHDFVQFAQWTADSLEGGQLRGEAFVRRLMDAPEERFSRNMDLNLPASCLAAMFDAQGPNANCVAACVSSSQAIGEASELIREDVADVMLAGGAHSMIHPFGLTGFLRLSVLSQSNERGPEAMRPFDRDRDGFVIGEGGAVLVLEELEHARRRGAEILAEIVGFSSSQDAFRITDSHPQGRGVTRCIQQALDDARLSVDQIDYINAHGTSTLLNDRQETMAIKQVFGRQAYRVPISSTKSMLGHSTTACGALETVVAVMAVQTGVIPPTINYHTPDPDCDLDYVPNTAREISVRRVLSNSFGFGGQNTALVIAKYQS
jgi:3-oxoacyl-[acyl-carrier-protein] synthase II